MLKGRKLTLNQLKNHQSNSKTAWFHCASVGEFEQARPIIEQFKKEFESFEIVITFFSPSGYELRKNYELANYVYYMPFDSPKNAKYFIDKIDPTIVFFIKYEFWYFFLKELSKRSCWVFSVSTIFRASQPFFKWYGGFYREILGYFDHIFVQNQSSANLLKLINMHHFSMAGDTRYDRVKTISEQDFQNTILESFCTGNEPVFVVGSSWPKDVERVAKIALAFPSFKFIIAPHEITEQQIQYIIDKMPIAYSRYSMADSQFKNDTRLLIIDNVGMLAQIYRFAKYAWIGGAYGAGLHNILEAAVYGVPVFFGNKNYAKFHEANEIIRLGAAFAIDDANEAIVKIEQFERNSESYMEVKSGLNEFIANQLGAVDVIINYCKRILKS